MKLTECLAACALVVLGWCELAVAGNGWNPPVKEPEEERRLQKVGGEFFKLQGYVYFLVSSVEEGDRTRARDAAEAVNRQLGLSGDQCAELRAFLTKNVADVRSAYQKFTASADAQTSRLVAARIINMGEPTWAGIAKGGAELPSLCGRTVQAISEAVKPILERVRRDDKPTQVEVWRLLNAVETGSKQSRYFSIILRP